MQKHILVISQYFYPEQFRINDICKEWINRGYKVTVLTGIPNYPVGKFYKGYNWFKKRKENFNGIKVIRIPILPRGKSSIGLLLNYFSFVFFGWFFSKFSRIDANYVFTYQLSPIFQAKLGIWFAKRKKIKSILYVMDLWPDSLEVVGGVKNKSILNWVSKVTKKIYNQSDYIPTSSSGFIESIEQMGIESKKIKFWPQYAEDTYSENHIQTDLIPNDGIPNLTFTGNIGKAQGLDILVEVAKILKKKNIFVRFNLVGDGRFKNELIKLIDESKVNEYFNFTGSVPFTKIPSILHNSDAAILTLIDNKILSKTIPAKLQSYMKVGIPIISNVSGEVNDIIVKSKSGLTAVSGDSNALVSIIETFLSLDEETKLSYGKNGLIYANKYFDKKTLLDDLDDIFLKLGDKKDV